MNHRYESIMSRSANVHRLFHALAVLEMDDEHPLSPAMVNVQRAIRLGIEEEIAAYMPTDGVLPKTSQTAAHDTPRNRPFDRPPLHIIRPKIAATIRNQAPLNAVTYRLISNGLGCPVTAYPGDDTFWLLGNTPPMTMPDGSYEILYFGSDNKRIPAPGAVITFGGPAIPPSAAEQTQPFAKGAAQLAMEKQELERRLQTLVSDKKPRALNLLHLADIRRIGLPLYRNAIASYRSDLTQAVQPADRKAFDSFLDQTAPDCLVQLAEGLALAFGAKAEDTHKAPAAEAMPAAARAARKTRTKKPRRGA